MDIFQSHPDVYTIFEPLRLVGYDRYVQREFLSNNILKCDFHSELSIDADYLKNNAINITKNWHNDGWWNRSMCHSVHVKHFCKNISALEIYCAGKGSLVTKVIRAYSIDALLQLMEDGVKIIYLVRDARAIAQSRIKVYERQRQIKKLSLNSVIKESRLYCLELERDIKSIKSFYTENAHVTRSNLRFLRFEDLALDPHKISQQLFSFADIHYNENVMLWIQRNTNIISERNTSLYSTTRNSASVVNEWMFRMKSNYVFAVQNVCKELLLKLGYNIINNLRQNYTVKQVKEKLLQNLS